MGFLQPPHASFRLFRFTVSFSIFCIVADNYEQPSFFLRKDPVRTIPKNNPLSAKNPWAQGKGEVGGAGVGEGGIVCVGGGIVPDCVGVEEDCICVPVTVGVEESESVS